MSNGRLFILLGASGSGKDGLLRYAASRCGNPARLRVARRAITRGPSADEHFEPISERQFNKRVASGAFALWWLAHGCGYGVPSVIDHWLRAGCTVLVNGSRHAFGAARVCYPDCQGIIVDVEPVVLRRRLRDKGRLDTTTIDRRLLRSTPALPFSCLHLDNNGSLPEAGEQLLDIVDPTRALIAG